MENFILITGASTGIGEHAASLFIRHGYSVLAGVRNPEDGIRLKEKLGDKIFPLLLDVTDEQHATKALQQAEEIIGSNHLVTIINNAGIAVSGTVLHIPIHAWRQQFEVNLFGVIRVTQLFFPLLKKSPAPYEHPRRIINISSVSGLFASPFLGPYVASKYALEGMSDSLRRELYMYDIQVVLIEPGNIRTPIWTKTGSTPEFTGPEYAEIITYKDRIIENNLRDSLAPEVLDDVLLKSVRDRKVRARYLIRPQKWKFQLIRLLPTGWIDRMIRKKLQARSGIRPF